MASLQDKQQETMATVDTAKALVDKVLTILELAEMSPKLSLTFATNPIGFILQMLEHTGVTYEELRNFLSNFLVYTLPMLETSVKGVLLTSMRRLISCSSDPRIPDKYRKEHKTPTNPNTSQEYGIDISVESIDYFGKLAISPLSDEGKELYFGLDGIEDVYKFARAEDFDAFLWFVIHKGRFANSSKLSRMNDLENFFDAHSANINGNSLLDVVTVQGGDNNYSSILLGNTFVYDKSSQVISMCIDAKYKGNDIVENTLVPISDDWSSVNLYAKNVSDKVRDYRHDKAICNVQYLEYVTTPDYPMTGLVNNKLRLSILPKPYVHIPSIEYGEPAWRFKKMLFNENGEYDPNGRYTVPKNIVETYNNNDKTISFGNEIFGNDNVVMNIKSGTVKVNNPSELKKHLFECYNGLTVYEFNYDYIMNMKLFDAKVVATVLLDSLVNMKVGASIGFGAQHDEAAEEIKEIIKNVINSDDSTVSDCFFKFDNSKYEALLRRAAEKRADKRDFTDVKEILNEYREDATLEEQIDILNRVITQTEAKIIDGADGIDESSVHFSFVTDLIEQLTLAIVRSLLTPKVLMLLEVNETIMGGKWKKFTVKDVIMSMRDTISAIVFEVRDLILQELMKLLLKYLSPIISTLTSAIVREQLEDYADTINDIIRNCPSVWFKLGTSTSYSDTKLDTVDYADIDIIEKTNGEIPLINNC